MHTNSCLVTGVSMDPVPSCCVLRMHASAEHRAAGPVWLTLVTIVAATTKRRVPWVALQLQLLWFQQKCLVLGEDTREGVWCRGRRVPV